MTNLSGANLNNGAAVGPQGEGRESPSSFPKYPAYKDSGVEWLGDVPEGWSVASLRFFADLITGITPPSDDLSNYAEEGWSWVRPEDLDDSGKPVLASKFLTEQGWVFCRKVKGQSTLICCIGTIGKLGFIETDACTNQQITAVVPRQGGRFYFYAMHALKPAFDAYATGNVLRILNSERLGSVEVAVPSKSEADSIARFLDHETARIDALIEEQQRLIELLKEKRQAVISHAVTKGLDPTVPMKDSGVEWLGEVPAHWNVKKLKHFGRVIGGFAFKSTDFTSDGHPVLKISNIGHLCFEWGDQSYLPDEFRESHSEFIAPKGALVFAMTRPVIAGGIKVARLEDDSLPLVNQRVGFMVVHDVELSRYLLLSTQSDPFLSQFKNNLTITNQPNISSEGIESISVAVPPLIEMKNILAFCLKVDAEVQSLIGDAFRGTELLQERRSALISAAVTGKIDVRSWQPPASTQAPKLAVAEAD